MALAGFSPLQAYSQVSTRFAPGRESTPRRALPLEASMPMGPPTLKRRPLDIPKLTQGAAPGGVDDKLGSNWRGTSSERGYDSRWTKARAGYLAQHPLCVCCLANGRTSAAQVVDHITPHKGDRVLFWDRDNWQALCWPCHREVKAVLEARWLRGEVSAAALVLSRQLPEFFAN